MRLAPLIDLVRGREQVVTMKPDLLYWPTLVFENTDGVWQRSEL